MQNDSVEYFGGKLSVQGTAFVNNTATNAGCTVEPCALGSLVYLDGDVSSSALHVQCGKKGGKLEELRLEDPNSDPGEVLQRCLDVQTRENVDTLIATRP